MKIHDIRILNWLPPGGPWWDDVESRPDEPLIEATMNLTLSWNEYREMLKAANSGTFGVGNAPSHGCVHG